MVFVSYFIQMNLNIRYIFVSTMRFVLCCFVRRRTYSLISLLRCSRIEWPFIFYPMSYILYSILFILFTKMFEHGLANFIFNSSCEYDFILSKLQGVYASASTNLREKNSILCFGRASAGRNECVHLHAPCC